MPTVADLRRVCVYEEASPNGDLAVPVPAAVRMQHSASSGGGSGARISGQRLYPGGWTGLGPV